MESNILSRATAGIAMIIAIASSGCATTSAPDYRGKWKPVNRYAAQTSVIPLAKTYVFFAAPMDGTLKTMLTRWSKDTGIKLSYQLGADYTLPVAAAHINTVDIYRAASELNAVYAPQGISIAVNDWHITVQAASDAKTAAPASEHKEASP